MERDLICYKLIESFEHCSIINEDGQEEPCEIEVADVNFKNTKGTNFQAYLKAPQSDYYSEYYLSLTIWQKSANIKVIEVVDTSTGAVDVDDICIIPTEIKRLKINLNSWTEKACNIQEWICWGESIIIESYMNMIPNVSYEFERLKQKNLKSL